MLAEARITGRHVFILNIDHSKLTLPDGVRQMRGIQAGFDATRASVQLPN